MHLGEKKFRLSKGMGGERQEQQHLLGFEMKTKKKRSQQRNARFSVVGMWEEIYYVQEQHVLFLSSSLDTSYSNDIFGYSSYSSLNNNIAFCRQGNPEKNSPSRVPLSFCPCISYRTPGGSYHSIYISFEYCRIDDMRHDAIFWNQFQNDHLRSDLLHIHLVCNSPSECMESIVIMI